MTRTQLFLTLAFVICATAPCADGMAAAPPDGPAVSDALWRGVTEVRAVVAGSIDGNIARIAEWALAVLVAWRYRSLVLAVSTGGKSRRRMASQRTVVGGVPASGVMGGRPPLARPPLPTQPHPSGTTGPGRLAVGDERALVR
jgi:hypothetical protein